MAMERSDDEEMDDETDESNEISMKPLSWVLGIHFFGAAVTVPALPSILLEIMQDDKAESARWSGRLGGLRSLLAFFFLPVLGAISDTRGRKPVMSLGLLSNSFCWLLVAAFPTVEALILATVIIGTTVSVVTTSFACITDITDRVLRRQRSAKKLETLRRLRRGVRRVKEKARRKENTRLAKRSASGGGSIDAGPPNSEFPFSTPPPRFFSPSSFSSSFSSSSSSFSSCSSSFSSPHLGSADSGFGHALGLFRESRQQGSGCCDGNAGGGANDSTARSDRAAVTPSSAADRTSSHARSLQLARKQLWAYLSRTPVGRESFQAWAMTLPDALLQEMVSIDEMSHLCRQVWIEAIGADPFHPQSNSNTSEAAAMAVAQITPTKKTPEGRRGAGAGVSTGGFSSPVSSMSANGNTTSCGGYTGASGSRSEAGEKTETPLHARPAPSSPLVSSMQGADDRGTSRSVDGPTPASHAAAAAGPGTVDVAPSVAIGARVVVRDAAGDEWEEGTVVGFAPSVSSIVPGWPLVLKDGWDTPFEWQSWGVPRHNSESQLLQGVHASTHKEAGGGAVVDRDGNNAAKKDDDSGDPEEEEEKSLKVRVGDRVLVKDNDEEQERFDEASFEDIGNGWGAGTVVRINTYPPSTGPFGSSGNSGYRSGEWPVVRCDGWDTDFEFDMCRKVPPYPLTAKKEELRTPGEGAPKQSKKGGFSAVATKTSSASPPLVVHHRAEVAAATAAGLATAAASARVTSETNTDLSLGGGGYMAPSALEVMKAVKSGARSSESGSTADLLSVGDSVEVRDFGEAEWGCGVVVGFEEETDDSGDDIDDDENEATGTNHRGMPNNALVKRDEFNSAYIWDECRMPIEQQKEQRADAEQSGTAEDMGTEANQAVIADIGDNGDKANRNSGGEDSDSAGFSGANDHDVEWRFSVCDDVGTVAFRRRDRPRMLESLKRQGDEKRNGQRILNFSGPGIISSKTIHSGSSDGGGDDNGVSQHPAAEEETKGYVDAGDDGEDDDEVGKDHEDAKAIVGVGAGGGGGVGRKRISSVLGRFDHTTYLSLTAAARHSGRVAGAFALSVACLSAAFLFLVATATATATTAVPKSLTEREEDSTSPCASIICVSSSFRWATGFGLIGMGALLALGAVLLAFLSPPDAKRKKHAFNNVDKKYRNNKLKKKRKPLLTKVETFAAKRERRTMKRKAKKEALAGPLADNDMIDSCDTGAIADGCGVGYVEGHKQALSGVAGDSDGVGDGGVLQIVSEDGEIKTTATLAAFSPPLNTERSCVHSGVPRDVCAGQQRMGSEGSFWGLVKVDSKETAMFVRVAHPKKIPLSSTQPSSLTSPSSLSRVVNHDASMSSFPRLPLPAQPSTSLAASNIDPASLWWSSSSSEDDDEDNDSDKLGPTDWVEKQAGLASQANEQWAGLVVALAVIAFVLLATGVFVAVLLPPDSKNESVGFTCSLAAFVVALAATVASCVIPRRTLRNPDPKVSFHWRIRKGCAVEIVPNIFTGSSSSSSSTATAAKRSLIEHAIALSKESAGVGVTKKSKQSCKRDKKEKKKRKSTRGPPRYYFNRVPLTKLSEKSEDDFADDYDVDFKLTSTEQEWGQQQQQQFWTGGHDESSKDEERGEDDDNETGGTGDDDEDSLLNSRRKIEEREQEQEAALLTQNFGRMGALWGLSFVCGPLIGGLLIGATGSARAACFLVAISELTAFVILKASMSETIRFKKKAQNAFTHALNPFHTFTVFQTSNGAPQELAYLMLPFVLAVAGASIHSILYLYFVVKFAWNAVTIGLFFSCVGVVTLFTQGWLLPKVVPSTLSVRNALVSGMFIHCLEYVLYAFCNQGWGLVLILCVCCTSGLEPPSMHALISSLVPASQQGSLHGSLTALRTLVSIVAVPFFTQLFAWSIGDQDHAQRLDSLTHTSSGTHPRATDEVERNISTFLSPPVSLSSSSISGGVSSASSLSSTSTGNGSDGMSVGMVSSSEVCQHPTTNGDAARTHERPKRRCRK